MLALQRMWDWLGMVGSEAGPRRTGSGSDAASCKDSKLYVAFSYYAAGVVLVSLKQDQRSHSVSRKYVQDKTCTSVKRKYGEG